MRGRQANPEFFNKAKQGSAHEQTIASSSLTKKFQQARREGHLNLSSVKPGLTEIPRQVFQLDAFLEEGEKFWEVEPLRSLDISFNAITVIPSEIGSLTNVHTLKARSNRITGPLPASLFTECVALRILDLSQNELTPSIPEEIGNLNELRDVSLSTNKLAQVPQSLFYLANLRALDLSHNMLQDLPPGLSCTTLVSLNLSHNRLRSIPSLAALASLESLHCASNQIQLLPELSALVQLKTLDASQNQLTSFPNLPRLQSKLNQLVLSYNRITEIDMTTLESQKQLSEFLIHNNALTILPPELEALQSLKVLDVSNNDIQDLPATLGYIATLQILKLEGNRIKTIRQTLLQKNCQEIKAYLRTRGPSFIHPHETEDDGLGPANIAPPHAVSSASLKSSRRVNSNADTEPSAAPSSLIAASAAASAAHCRQKLVSSLTFRLRDINGGQLDLSKLQLQDESWNEIVEILSPYPSVHTIKALQLQNNCFRKLPYEVLSAMEELFTELQSIRLAHNLLGLGFQNSRSTVNEDVELASWPRVLGIDLGYNRLTAGMIDILLTCGELQSWKFPSLTELVLEHNPLGDVPQFLSAHSSFHVGTRVRSPSLRRLQLNGCQLRFLTDAELDFRVFVHLSHLDVSDNQLSSLPASLPSADKLQFLSIENNNFREIPSVLGVLPSLQSLLIQGNPQKHIRTNVIQQGSVKILQYLREKHLPSEAVVSAGGAQDSGTSSMQAQQNIAGAAVTNTRGQGIHHQKKAIPSVFESASTGGASMRPVSATAANSRQFASQEARDDNMVPLTQQFRSNSISSSRTMNPNIGEQYVPPRSQNSRQGTSLAHALRMRQECTETAETAKSRIPTAVRHTASTSSNSTAPSSSLISARMKVRPAPAVSQHRPQQSQFSSGGGRSDPSAYW